MSKDTGRKYTDGTPIMVGDIIADQDNIQGKVFETKKMYRVAVDRYDERDGTGISLGLFIVQGSTKVN